MSLAPTLTPLTAQLKRGIFDEGLRIQISKLWQALDTVSDRGESYYKAKSIVSEVSYYFDDIELARESVKEFEKFEISSCSRLNHRVAREQIRCYLAHIQATVYHENEYKKARNQIEQCINFVAKKLVRRNFNCFATLAWAHYQLGCCLRQLNKLEDAEEAFVRSIKYQSDRLLSRKLAHTQVLHHKRPDSLHAQHPNAPEELLFCNRRIAIALGLGMGFCNYTRGRLSAAYEELIISRALIAYCGDKLNEAYLDLLLGSVMRCKAGSDPSGLKDAERAVGRSCEVFKTCKHKRYATRATYELALIHLGLADRKRCKDNLFNDYLRKATGESNEVLEVSRGFGDSRWASKALVLRSRIERKLMHFQAAIDFANEALSEAGDQTLCEIDARIARAEAKISWVSAETQLDRPQPTENMKDTRLSNSREDLDIALELNKGKPISRSSEIQNEKIDAVCKLHIARSYVLEGNYVQATRTLRVLKRMKNIEHKAIIELWREVKADMARIKPEFNIDWSSDKLDYDLLTTELGSILLGIAKQKYPSNQRQRAIFLGLPRTTLRNLENTLEKVR